MSLRSRLLGSALLVVALAAFAASVSLAPTVPPEPAADAVSGVIATTPLAFVVTPALFAVAAVLLIGGTAALAGADLSARATLLAPAIGGLTAFAVVVGALDAPATILPALVESDALSAAAAGPPGAIATGAVAGGAVAPVVQATVTEDTPALLAGSVLLLAALAVGASDLPSLVTGGVGGAVAVVLLWAVDPDRWRP